MARASQKRRRRLVVWLAAGTLLVLSVLAVYLAPSAQFFLQFESLGKNAHGLNEYRHRQTGIVFIRLGLPAEPLSDGGQQRHPPYLLAVGEVTQAEWTAVMGLNPATFQSGMWNEYLLRKGEDTGQLPVDSVSWNECEEFCRRTGLRFPTEAEWEYACRAGSTTAYSFGDVITRRHAMYSDKNRYPSGAGLPRVVTMETFPSNGYGVYNMHGNVAEWCYDTYGDLENDERAVRGGAWRSPGDTCTCEYRWGFGVDTRSELMGFRPAFTAP